MVRAAVMERPMERIAIHEFDDPEMEEGSLTIRTLYSEVCGTDVHLHHGKLAGVPYPIIPGHVNVGAVEKIKGEVRDVHGHRFQPGELITFFDVHETCNECWHCLVAKATTRCPSRKVYGITYSANDGLLGGWSEIIYVKPGVRIVPLGDMDPEVFIGGGCGLLTAFHAVERSGVRLGDTVVIQGTGPVGLSAVAWSRLSGARRVIAVGAPELRLEFALKMGADQVVNILEIDPGERIEKIKELTEGRGADITIECSGNPMAVPEGMRMTRDSGCYVIVGQYTDGGEVPVNPHLDINKKHLDIRGCWGFDFSHIYKAVDMLKRVQKDFGWHELISKKYALNELNEALKDVENLEVVKAVVEPNRLA
ncbi:zinc-binding dehydrogenase [candidate division KSB1 bacterium]